VTPNTKTWLDRSLSLISDVRPGEGATALLLAANVFFLLAAYSVLKVVRESLILAEGGAVTKSYAAAGQAALLLVFVPLYGAFASRVNRRWLVCGVTLFFASHLLVFVALGLAGIRIGLAFYLWIGIFNMVVIAQFWAFTNDLFTPDRGRRLLPVVGIGASLGAVVGAGLTSIVFARVGPFLLMLVSAAGLFIPIGLTMWVSRREKTSGSDAAAASADAPLRKAGGFHLIVQERYLLLIAMLMVVLNLVNTIGEFLFARMVQTHAVALVASGASGGLGTRELIGTMVGGMQTWVNAIGFVFQLFLASRVLAYAGVRGALFVLPVVALASYSMMALFPVFGIVKMAKILENSTDYSIQNTTRHALFLPTSREAKYKAKQAIDSFFVRTGDLLQAVVVFAGTALSLDPTQFAALNVVFVGLALVLVTLIGREYAARTTAHGDVSLRQAA